MELFIIFLSSILITIAYNYWKYRYRKTQSILLESINNYETKLKETKENYTIKLWAVYKYTEEDIQKLIINKESLDIVVKILTYYTATATDNLRWQVDTNKILRASGNADWFHEMLVFFWKLQNESNKPANV